mmetsp:Transcript_47943/g.94591  ORF Transcript_47943/g.94591 Transcript_47943/m.94591 type:complete len:106 (+) Transcript_47943:1585-1902(+)
MDELEGISMSCRCAGGLTYFVVRKTTGTQEIMQKICPKKKAKKRRKNGKKIFRTSEKLRSRPSICWPICQLICLSRSLPLLIRFSHASVNTLTSLDIPALSGASD